MKKLVIAACALTVLASCEKENSTTPTLTKKEMLVAHSWVQTKAESVISGIKLDVTAAWLQECEKDDFMTYSADGKVVLDNGTSKCLDNEAKLDNGTWTLTENDTKLNVTLNGDTEIYTIESFTENQMVVNLTDELMVPNGALRVTFTKK